ncbi:MAG: MFS transporter [Bacteroidales bacterium]|nr:MFS transporter [Bacteroidales bacterium]
MKKFCIPYKWELVIFLWLAFFFNQADRQIFNIVLTSIRDDLGLSDANMGLIATIFTLFYGLMVPVGGILGDRINKKYILIISLLIWSAATLVTGFSFTLVQLIVLRSIALGGGEALYAPSANSLICEYHQNTRATAMSIHQTALYVGIIGSGYLTGYIADSFGWRIAFYLFGGFGIILAAVFYFRVKDSKVLLDAVITPGAKKSVTEVLKVFFTKPTAILLALAFAGMQFAGVGFLTWMPTFLHEKFNFSLARAGFDSTFYHHVAAFIGVILGARIADKLAQKYFGTRGFVQMVGLAIGAPFIYMIGKSNSIMIIYLALAIFGFCRGIYDSNIFAALYDVIEIPYRATATGIMLMFAFIIGSASPYILGVLKPVFGLSNGLKFLSIGYLFAAVCIFIALVFFYKSDRV